MTEQDAIKNVTTYVIMEAENISKDVVKALDVMMNCTRKQIPKNLINFDRTTNTGLCPICGNLIDLDREKYCYSCGQRLYWSDSSGEM